LAIVGGAEEQISDSSVPVLKNHNFSVRAKLSKTPADYAVTQEGSFSVSKLVQDKNFKLRYMPLSFEQKASFVSAETSSTYNTL